MTTRPVSRPVSARVTLLERLEELLDGEPCDGRFVLAVVGSAALELIAELDPLEECLLGLRLRPPDPHAVISKRVPGGHWQHWLIEILPLTGRPGDGQCRARH